ncbi:MULTISPECIES: RNA polymerase sigma factor [Parabacteroides]|jgi:RNA polymerase sigma factor, sigma-70 family|uniref:RNA polymerase sigma factor (Sigma-70 family) n=1 Tax=Parabacteroides faecis TaxID=1217282 RepID=A0ABR6KFW2_9BACT|nr:MULTISPECIES: sigma-70 family RNA polymerase sigma factor [Parabacteroides]MBB4620394.1 RNA polymerase sigma factor (sigma-70 family) [Parabacteroides faecis]MBC8616653.1 sigma-70 family RNA polymerase sigma factor [Parabacteroides faecis]RHR42017.1 sigma-70 family RNA polymerase sigma factor [Parabacteroides sp. AF18-52]RHR94148.1 sigma-70 family RNA polymerase sigma factor [Parabacteroides sp. AF14-59]GGJ97091.1 RNA polymerase subunit sigma-24 [Parabacteroides faecis]
MKEISTNTSANSERDIRIADIFRKYQAQLKGFIAKRVSSKEDSEDILQNVFYQFMKSDQEDNPIEQIAAWLYSVARNQIIDRSRKHREEEMPYLSNNEDDGTFLKELSELMPDEDQSPEMDFIRSTVWEELENALLELPGEQRTVFELTELEGIPFKEIAESTGIPVNTLISRKRYAILFLRKRLYSLYEDIL